VHVFVVFFFSDFVTVHVYTYEFNILCLLYTELDPSEFSSSGDRHKHTSATSDARHLRSTYNIAKQPTKSSHILPTVCIVCRSGKTFQDSRGRKQKEPLTLCEQIDGGKLRLAAEEKDDKNILVHIRDRDCVAIEVRYHRSCYKGYTDYLRRSNPQHVHAATEQIYSQAFDSFCNYTIDQKILKNKEIYRLTSLKRIFDKAVKDIEGKDSSNYKTHSLKQRIRRRYPQLCFIQPKKKYQSELVYIDTLSAEALVRDTVTSETDTNTTDTDTTDAEESPPPVKRPKQCNRRQVVPQISSLRERYSTALDLKNAVMDTTNSTTLPWPPTSGDLTMDAARQIVPTMLYNFLAWVVGASDDPEGVNRVKVGDVQDHRILTIAQDIIYLATKGKTMLPKQSSLAMAVRHLSGSAQLIGLLNGFGYSISHTSVLEHDTALAQQEVQRGSRALPSCLQKSVFTTLIWDNNDFGEQTLSGKDTTHNTNGIAVQHAEIHQDADAHSTLPPVQGMRKTRKRSLPAPHTEVVTFSGEKKSSPKAFAGNMKLEMTHYEPTLYPHKKKDAAFYITKWPQKRLLPAWTGFNQLLTSSIPPKATIAYLPVVNDSPTDLNTVNTILHRSIEIADQLELPSVVVVMDQAIYAKAQTIRWQTPIFMDRIVIRLGAFHTTMTALACVGKRFQDAGLQDVLIESSAVAPGSVSGVMNGHNYNRSIRCHKLMAGALHRLCWQSFMESVPLEMQEQYRDVISSLQSSFPGQYVQHVEGASFQAMMNEYDIFITEGNKNATFAFWNSYLEMIEDILLFIRATREGNWHLHLAAVRALLPWIFAYDRTNYSRYLPVYWFEMSQLPTSHQYIYKELVSGHFAVQRQDTHGFAQVACDMTIEQTANRDSKTRGGIKGFSTNQGATNRWIRAHHQRAAITRQCEEMAGKGQKSSKRADLTNSRMTRDEDDVNNIMSTITSMTNPFENDPEMDANDLVHLSSGVIAPDDVYSDLMTAKVKGDEAFVNFSKSRLQGNDVDLNKTLKKMKLKTFSDAGKQTIKVKGKDVTLKSDRELLARLVIIGKVRKVNLKSMMTYSLSPYPPALATYEGCLVKTNKARLLHYLESVPESSPVVDPPKGGVWVVDGMAMLQQMSSKGMPASMGQLAEKILRQLVYLALSSTSNSVHFVTDTYPSISIKGAERKRRAASGSQRIKISKADQPVPKQWKKYLANSFNKEQLVHFLFNHWSTCGEDNFKGITLYVAHGKMCHSITPRNGTISIEEIPQLHSTQEEADTRMLLHAHYISTQGIRSIIIKSPDTDVFVIGVALVSHLVGSQLYFHTGRDDNVRTIDLQAIQQELGDDIAKAIIGLHCFTGCDSVSSFYGKGKTKAIKLLTQNKSFSHACQMLGESFSVTDELVSLLEDFVCKLYSQQEYSHVNDARYSMFSMATRNESVMPPNRDALIKHVQRANFQAAVCKRSFDNHPDIPSPAGHGWKLIDGSLSINWMEMQPAQQSILELSRCTCKKSKCKASDADDQCCVSLGLCCTELCECKNCDNMHVRDDDAEESEEEMDEVGDICFDEENFEEEESF